MKLKDFKVGMKIIWFSDNPIDTFREEGTVKEVFDDHILIDVPNVSDHIWIDEDCLDMIDFVKEEK